jgi:aromatic ring-opening dioxygenase catalytic subunit (LigB family)
MLIMEEDSGFPSSIGARGGPHSQFLQLFGRFLLQKYKPKAIVVFSAHWETSPSVEGKDTTVFCLYL